MRIPRFVAIAAIVFITLQSASADDALFMSNDDAHEDSIESRTGGATTEPCSYDYAANGIVPPDLSECAILGRNIARTKYYEEMLEDMQRMSTQLHFTTSLYSACHLFSGSTRNACCQRIMDRSISQCKAGVIAEEKLESPCAPRQIDCKLLRPAKCLLERAIERKRVQCCQAIDAQILKHLLNYCTVVVEQVSADCKVPEEPATPPVSVGTVAPEILLQSPVF